MDKLNVQLLFLSDNNNGKKLMPPMHHIIRYPVPESLLTRATYLLLFFLL